MKSLLLMASVASAAVLQHCMGFEPSGKNRQVIVETESDVSVLIYNIGALGNSNIPMMVNDEILREEPNGFGICTQEKFSQGHCDSVGKFTVDGDYFNEVVSKRAEFNVTREAIVCALVFQEGDRLTGVKVREVHSYGHLPLEMKEVQNVYALLLLLLVITLVALLVTFRGKRRESIGTIFHDIMILLVMKQAQASQMLNVFVAMNRSANRLSLSNYVDIIGAIDVMYMVGTYLVYYKLSSGIFGITKEERDKVTFQPLFKRCLIIMGASGAIVCFAPLLTSSGIAPLNYIVLAASAALSFVWMPMVYVMYKNADRTYAEIVDPVFGRNYLLSKRCVIWIPISMSILSFFGTVVVVLAIAPQGVGNMGGNFEQNVTSMMEVTLNQNYGFVLLKHLGEFSMLVVQWALLWIWKPHLLDRTIFENVHSNELAEGTGEVKL